MALLFDTAIDTTLKALPHPDVPYTEDDLAVVRNAALLAKRQAGTERLSLRPLLRAYESVLGARGLQADQDVFYYRLLLQYAQQGDAWLGASCRPPASQQGVPTTQDIGGACDNLQAAGSTSHLGVSTELLDDSVCQHPAASRLLSSLLPPHQQHQLTPLYFDSAASEGHLSDPGSGGADLAYVSSCVDACGSQQPVSRSSTGGRAVTAACSIKEEKEEEGAGPMLRHSTDLYHLAAAAFARWRLYASRRAVRRQAQQYCVENWKLRARLAQAFDAWKQMCSGGGSSSSSSSSADNKISYISLKYGSTAASCQSSAAATGGALLLPATSSPASVSAFWSRWREYVQQRQQRRLAALHWASNTMAKAWQAWAAAALTGASSRQAQLAAAHHDNLLARSALTALLQHSQRRKLLRTFLAWHRAAAESRAHTQSARLRRLHTAFSGWASAAEGARVDVSKAGTFASCKLLQRHLAAWRQLRRGVV